MPAPKPEQLTRREREIMDAIFALGDRASAEDIRERLSDPPSYSAVRAMLVKLDDAGSRAAHGAASDGARVLRRLAWRGRDRAAQTGSLERRGARRAAPRDRS